MKGSVDIEKRIESEGDLTLNLEGKGRKFSGDSSFLIRKFKDFDPNLAIAELDLSFKIISADENYHFLLGYKKGELINENHSKILSNEFLCSEKYEVFEKEVRDGHFLKGKFTRINKKGEEIVLEGVYFPVMDEWQRMKKIVNIYFNENSRSSKLPFKGNEKVLENASQLKTTSSEFRILIIEDARSLNSSLKKFLHIEGFKEIIVCKTGAEAIELSTTFKPGIIILNYKLKGRISASEISDHIQKSCNCPVIFISSFSKDIQELNKNLTRSYFLDEPVDRKQLISLIKHIQLL